MYNEIKDKIREKLTLEAKDESKILELLECSVGRLYLKSAKEGRNWEAELRPEELSDTTNWLKAAVVTGVSWLKDLDVKARPKRLMAIQGFSELLHEINKDLGNSILRSAKKLPIVSIALASALTVNSALAAGLNKEINVPELSSWKLRGVSLEAFKDEDDVNQQFAIGQLYLHGEGVVKNEAEAARWYGFAAKQGHTDAQYKLGKMYYDGIGVDQDTDAAVYWTMLSAKGGNPYAQNGLGEMYYYGEGVPENSVTANMWMELALVNGFDRGEDFKEYIVRRMSSDDVDLSEILAEICLESEYKDCGLLPLGR